MATGTAFGTSMRIATTAGVAAGTAEALSPGSEPVTAYDAQVLAREPSLYVRCDELSGPLSDLSGNGNHLTVHGSVTRGVAGLSETGTAGIRLTGGYLSAANTGSLNVGAGPVSVVAWIKRTTVNNTVVHPVYGKGVGAPFLAITSTLSTGGANNLRFHPRGGNFAARSTTSLTDTADWHQVGGTFGSTWKVYIDGVERTSAEGAGGSIADTIADLEIGRDPANPSDIADFSINNIALYPTELSAADIAADYLAGTGDTPTEPGDYPPTTTLQTVATPSVSRPAYLAVITDPTWGTEVRRITPDGSADRNSYAKIPVWNADGTRILLGYQPSSAEVLNAATFAVTHTISPGTAATWANTDPDVIYAAGSGDNVFRTFQYDGTLLTSRTFTGYSVVSMGNGEGGVSDDDSLVALQTVASGVPGLMLYNIATDTIVATVTLSEAPNNCKVSASGQYVIANFSGDGTGQHDGVWVFAASGSTLVRQRQLTIFGRHGDCGRDAASNDVWVTSIDKLSSFRMDTGARTDLLTNPNAFLVGHVSCRNIDRPGWAYVSVYQGTTSIGPGKDQVAAVKLDGSGDMQVFAHAHHVSAGADATEIESPFAVPNRDGTKVAFGSEWDSTGRVNMYLAGMDV